MQTIIAGDRPLAIGKQGENNARRVLFNYGEWRNEFGSGTCSLVHTPSTGTGYPVVLEDAGDGVAFWNISNQHNAVVGVGVCELTYTVGTTVVKSRTWQTVTEKSETGAGDPPAAWTAVLDQVGALANSAAASATSAATAKTAAEAAETGAGSAKASAESAATRAETARSAAQTARTGATNAKTAAETAQAAAEAAQAGSEAAKADAETAQAAAAASAASIVNMTVGAEAADAPSVTKTTVDGHYHLQFGIKNGRDGTDANVTKANIDAALGTDIVNRVAVVQSYAGQLGTGFQSLTAEYTSHKHNQNAEKHVTEEEKAAWGSKADQSDLTSHVENTTTAHGIDTLKSNLNQHTGNTSIHVTADEKTTWNGKLSSNPSAWTFTADQQAQAQTALGILSVEGVGF